jgi:hypothetical protein
MAEFVCSTEGFENKTIKASTAYAAAHRYALSELSEQATDDDEYEVRVVSRETGKVMSYTVRAEVSTHWVVTRNKDNDEGDDE